MAVPGWEERNQDMPEVGKDRKSGDCPGGAPKFKEVSEMCPGHSQALVIPQGSHR